MHLLRKFKKFNINSKAFTLAEVLIVLGVIGVVAALTLPSLISNYQKIQYVTGLKKASSVLSQAFKLYMVDEGVTDLSQTSLFSSDYDYTTLSEVLRKYFKITELCDLSTNYDYKLCEIYETYLNTESGKSQYFVNGGYGASVIYTIDGMAFEFYFRSDSGTCKPDYNNPSNMKGECLDVRVDINGPKAPNIIGRDAFLMLIGPNGNVYPTASREAAQWTQYVNTGSIDGWESYYWANKASGDWNVCDPGASNTYGWDCAARIRDEGWKMIY